MPGNIIVLGKLNKELYYESNFYDKVIEEIVSQLVNFIRYNPDDLSKEVIKKIVTRGFSNVPNKIIGPVNLIGEEVVTIHLSF
ncbi:MAG: hypothetical protein KAW66_04525 [Candidatus Lokiarchaeota archaeon]|nr:hypothetical protein [Candidatus Lokiarchaeota archaeon]